MLQFTKPWPVVCSSSYRILQGKSILAPEPYGWDSSQHSKTSDFNDLATTLVHTQNDPMGKLNLDTCGVVALTKVDNASKVIYGTRNATNNL